MNPLEARRRLLGRNVYKRTTEGNPAIAQGSLARMYPGITMQGWTEQDSTTGAQLLQPIENTDKNTTTVLGVSFSQDNMKFKISGTATGDGGRTTYFAKAILQPGTYYLSISKSINKLTIIISDFSTNLYISGVGAFEISEITEIGFGFNVTNGTIFDDEVEIMLNAGSTALPWEPYTGNQPSPSPDYLQEVINAGKYNEESQKWEYKVNVTGKNLIPYGEGNIKIGIPYETNGRTYILNKDGSISITTQDPSLATGSVFIFGSAVKNAMYKLEPGTYSASIFCSDLDTHPCTIQFCDAEGNNIKTQSVNGKPFKINEGEYIKYVWLYGIAGTVWNVTIYPQIELTESTSYEPYKHQYVYLTSDRPLTKWDKLEKRNGQWGWVYKSAEIETYTDESVPGEYYSTTGQLSVGAQVWYETAAETFVPLSPEEQEAMNALHTFRPTTVLSNDCECNMALTYKTKKSLENLVGGGIRKADKITSKFVFGVKWNQIDKIVLKASGITSTLNNMFFCSSNMTTPYISINNTFQISLLKEFNCNFSENQILNGEHHEIVFTFDKPTRDMTISNVWDAAWSKNIIYHEIMFYDGENLLADYVPYYKGAGYMLDKVNHVVIEASDPEAYQFA